ANSRGYEGPAAKAFFVEKLQSIGPEDVEAIRTGASLGKPREARRVQPAGLVTGSACSRPGVAEKLYPAIWLAPCLVGGVDGDRGGVVAGEVLRVLGRGLGQPDDLEVPVPGEVGGIDVRPAARVDGRDRTKRSGVEKVSGQARYAM